ncbi:hypothetical protein AURDEDRAFT_125636 [Auricularia subglabra TFB-10046 SS5]|nr:hypothetical protein AURDEDRAFT_125636 [Auricularia subglabra TFB-10046 SS5]
MQFSRIAIAILAALAHSASAAPCTPYETAGAIAQPTDTPAPAARPAPMPFFKGNNNPENIEWDDVQASRAAHTQRRVYWRKSSRRASSPPPPMMRSFAERRTSRY